MAALYLRETAYVVMLGICITGITGDNVCSPVERTADLSPCLDAIRSLFFNDTAFWFGTSHDERCERQWTSGVNSTVDCVDLYGRNGLTLESRIFRSPGHFNSETIDRYLDVTITSEPGSFTGCGHTVETEEHVHVTLDPLSTDAIEPWSLRGVPSVTVETSSVSAADPPVYSLLVVDPGFKRIHGFYLNFNGRNLSEATSLLPYYGSVNPRSLPNVYVWLLFGQNSVIGNVPDTVQGYLQTCDVMGIINQFQLTGPLAANWYLASYDAFSVEMVRQTGLMDNCASLVRDALRVKRRSFADNDPYLSVNMLINIYAEPYSYKMCGIVYQLSDSLVVDPLGMNVFDPAQIQTDLVNNMTINLSMNKLRPDASADFAGKSYTLLLVDPDVSEGCLGDGGHPMLMMAAVDVKVMSGGRGGWATLDLASGTTVLPYLAPDPNDTATHTIYFLLYQQPDPEIGISLMTDPLFRFYDGKDCPAAFQGRCLFDIRMFATLNTLELVGASWFLTSRSDWAAYRQGADETIYCAAPMAWSPSGVCPQQPEEEIQEEDPGNGGNRREERGTLEIFIVSLLVINLI